MTDMRTGKLAALATLTMCLLAGTIIAGRAADGISNTFTPEGIQAELAKSRDSIAREDYWGAIARLNDIITADPRNADAHNLLGFSYRKSKNLELAERSYERALRLDPEHKGALEYIGELYLETGRRAQAEDVLQTLRRLCPAGCEELDDLRESFSGKGS